MPSSLNKEGKRRGNQVFLFFIFIQEKFKPDEIEGKKKKKTVCKPREIRKKVKKEAFYIFKFNRGFLQKIAIVY